MYSEEKNRNHFGCLLSFEDQGQQTNRRGAYNVAWPLSGAVLRGGTRAQGFLSHYSRVKNHIRDNNQKSASFDTIRTICLHLAAHSSSFDEF